MLSIITAAASALARRKTVTPATGELSADLAASFAAIHADAAVPLWRYLYRAGGDRAVADDLVQESFLRLLQRPGLIVDRGAARPYLYRIASNLLRDRWRRLARRGRLDPEPPPEKVEPHGHQSQMRQDVQAVLGGLSSRERALIWLAHVDGYRHQEIAGILGLERASVKVLLHRAKTKLLSLLDDHGYAPGRDR